MSVESVVPETMSQSAFADLAGVSRKTVTIWKKKGFVFVGDDGQVDVERSVAVLRDRGLGDFDAVTLASEVVTPVTLAAPVTDEPSAARELTTDEIAERLVRSEEYALLSFGEAERLKENYLALSGRLKYEREAGTLVNRVEVEAKFAERWTAERTAWENWPSGCAANMAADLGADVIKLRVTLEKYVEEHLLARVRRAENAAPA